MTEHVPPPTGPTPADQHSTPVDGVDVLGSLSPSRAGDFLTCPLLYRFRTIDRLPEPSSPDAVRGTVVHKVLEDLFDLPAAHRTPERAQGLLEPTWEALQEVEPELGEMFDDAGGGEIGRWLASCRTVLDRYFTLEDPRRLEPAQRELYVESLLESKLLLRGFVDRIDVAPDGAIRIVDYKGLSLDTPLPTPRGWTTMGEVEMGDDLVGSDGLPTRVTEKSATHHRPCYRVTLRDGSTVTCDNVHLWTVTTSRRQVQTTHTVDTDALFELHRGLSSEGTPSSLWIEAGAALETSALDVPIDPWLLGAWLGDGATRSGRITVGHADSADMLALVKEHWPRDVRVSDEPAALSVGLCRLGDRCLYGHTEFLDPTPSRETRRCAHESQHARMTPSNISFTAELRQARLIGNKHVPRVYFRSGTTQRVQLLRGLMDTDGWYNTTRSRAGFTTTSDQLAADAIELLRTLGIHPMHFSKPHQNEVRPDRTWHVIEFTPTWFNPFSLPRKASACDAGNSELQRTLARRRIISSVEPIDSVPTQCVAVDAPDALYVCGSGWVPTHNTGRSPGEGFEAKALFQMKFYALVIWRTRGVMPAMLQLIYLGNGEILRYAPDEQDLLATERKVESVWRAIRSAQDSGDWRPRRSRLCGWCAHQSICPEFGGTPPPLPVRDAPRPDGPAGA